MPPYGLKILTKHAKLDVVFTSRSDSSVILLPMLTRRARRDQVNRSKREPNIPHFTSYRPHTHALKFKFMIIRGKLYLAHLHRHFKFDINPSHKSRRNTMPPLTRVAKLRNPPRAVYKNIHSRQHRICGTTYAGTRRAGCSVYQSFRLVILLSMLIHVCSPSSSR